MRAGLRRAGAAGNVSRDASLGAFEGEEAEIFTRPAGARFLSDGRVVVGDGLSLVLRYFDASGALLSSRGSRGEGPGEFMRTALVQQPTPVRRAGVERALGPRLSRASPLSTGVVAIEPGMTTIDITGVADGVLADSAPLPLYDRDGRERARADAVLAYERLTYRGSSMTRPFGARLMVAGGGGPDRRGNGPTPELTVHDATGAPLGTAALPLAARELTDDLAQARHERFLSRVGEASREETLRHVNVVPQPENVPFFDDLLGDLFGRLWVRRYGEPGEPSEWVVLDRDLEPFGRLVLPARYELADAHDADVLLIESDELGRQRVVSLALQW